MSLRRGQSSFAKFGYGIEGAIGWLDLTWFWYKQRGFLQFFILSSLHLFNQIVEEQWHRWPGVKQSLTQLAIPAAHFMLSEGQASAKSW